MGKLSHTHTYTGNWVQNQISQFLIKLNMNIPYNPEILLLGIYLKEINSKSHKKLYTIVTATLFLIAKYGNNPYILY